MRITCRCMLALAVLLLTAQLFAQDTTSVRTKWGVQTDLLPLVLSASTGHWGGALQVWEGREHWRGRVVVAHLHLPNSLIGNDDFENQSVTTIAALTDYVFGENFRGPWLGAGVEAWRSRIEHEASGKHAAWTRPYGTIGGGYIFALRPQLYLDLWAATHVMIGDREIQVSNQIYEAQRVTGEISVKIGWEFGDAVR